MWASTVRYDNPLKQGLKLAVYVFGPLALIVRYDNPLKQGLKHVNAYARHGH